MPVSAYLCYILRKAIRTISHLLPRVSEIIVCSVRMSNTQLFFAIAVPMILFNGCLLGLFVLYMKAGFDRIEQRYRHRSVAPAGRRRPDSLLLVRARLERPDPAELNCEAP